MVDDPKHCPPRAMRLQSTPAKIADGTAPKRLARYIDFTANAPPQPLSLFRSRCATQLFNRANKFMPRNTPKVVIAVQQLHVGIADTRKPHAYARPSWPQFRHWPGCCFQFSIFHPEGKHGAVWL